MTCETHTIAGIDGLRAPARPVRTPPPPPLPESALAGYIAALEYRARDMAQWRDSVWQAVEWDAIEQTAVYAAAGCRWPSYRQRLDVVRATATREVKRIAGRLGCSVADVRCVARGTSVA